jgi:hypothetical protein
LRSVVAVGTVVGMLAFALPALANAPNPDTTTVDQVTVNSDGSRTVTVQGTWTWATQNNCSTARNGVGYQIVWFDNTANAIGSSAGPHASPNGILYVGDAQDNIVHSVETLGGSSGFGNAFYDGAPSSYLTHNTTSSTPTSTDAQNWDSQCDGVNSSGVTAGSWGPISHTYASSFTGPITLCPILYDPHGGHDNSGQSNVNDITAGSNAATKNHNNDNSYEGNGTGANGNTCPTINIPTLTTSASSGTGAIHDTATLTGSSGNGTITFNLYPAGSGCSGSPLYTSSVPTPGDGDYRSGDYTPTSSGTYQWQASYASSTISGLISACNDPNEQSTATHQNHHGKPEISVAKLDSVHCSDLAAGASQPSGILPCTGVWSPYTQGVLTVQVPFSGSYSILIDYQIRVTNTGDTPLALSLSDPRCDAGTISGPTLVSGTLTGATLSVGGKAYYTCQHTLTQNDPNRNASGEPFTNTATVTGTPPTGRPVHGHGSVTVHRKAKPKARKFCRSFKTGQEISYTGNKKPRACEPRKPHHPSGFTG